MPVFPQDAGRPWRAQLRMIIILACSRRLAGPFYTWNDTDYQHCGKACRSRRQSASGVYPYNLKERS